MSEPVYERITYNRQKSQIKEQIKVECKTDVAAIDLAAVLSVGAWTSVGDADVSDGKIGYGGRAIFYLSFVNGEGEVKKIECGAEFSGALIDKTIAADSKAVLYSTVDKTEVDTSGAKVKVCAFITIKAEVSGYNECSALVSGENLVVDSKEIEWEKSLGLRQGVYPIEEEFELAYPVEEVLYHRAEGVITAVQCGVGTIIVDGETQIDLVLLQKNQKSDIIKESKTFPFRMEVDCEDAMPTMQANARVKVAAFKTDVTVDGESGSSTVNFTATLKFFGEAFSSSSLNVAVDAFCTENEVQIENQKLCCYKSKEQRTITLPASGRAAVNELPVGALVMAVGGERIETVQKEIDGEVLSISGVVTAVGYFSDGENKVFTRKMEIPFVAETEIAIEKDTEIEITAIAKGFGARVVSLTEMDCRAEVVVTVYQKTAREISVINKIDFLGERKKCDAAISVYIPEEGEDLWALSKRLNVCTEKLV